MRCPRHYLLHAIKCLLLELFIFSWTFLTRVSVQQLKVSHVGRNFFSYTPKGKPSAEMSCRIFCWQGEVFQGTDMMSVQSPAPITSVRAVSTQCFYNLDSSCPENQKHGAGSSKGKEKKKKSWLERQEELCWCCAGAWLCCTVNEPGVKEQSDAGVGKGFRQCARWLAFANFCIAKFLFFYVSSCTLLFLHLIQFFLSFTRLQWRTFFCFQAKQC